MLTSSPTSYPVCSRRAASRLCFDSSPGLMLPPPHSFLISTPNCFCLSSFLLLSHESMNYPFALLCSQGLLEGMETLLMYSQPMSSLPAIILSAPPNITGPALAQPPANQPQSWVPFAVRTLLCSARLCSFDIWMVPQLALEPDRTGLKYWCYIYFFTEVDFPNFKNWG